MSQPKALSITAFLTLMLIGLMMGSNHVAARIAFGSGLDVATAVLVRSGVTALVVALLIWGARVRLTHLSARQRKVLLVTGCLIGLQSQCIYSSVARLPVALALLAFNTYPLFTALWDRLLYKNSPSRAMSVAMPLILLGLGLALDVLGAASGLGASTQWAQMGAGVAFALAAAASFGLALILTQHETQGLDGRWRTLFNMCAAFLIALAVVAMQGAPHWPGTAAGWGGLMALSGLYGTAFTIMFMVLPRLGAAQYSAIMNVEPIFALLLAWWVLDQSIALSQILGAVLVVGTVIWLGLRKPA
jgi:drug/metabolite transporter (DMT)-like permease